jgi:hypothetical protein
LTSGLNVFAVTGISGSAALLVAIQITYSDNTTDTIVSDKNWLAFGSVPKGYQDTSIRHCAVGTSCHPDRNPSVLRSNQRHEVDLDD